MAGAVGTESLSADAWLFLLPWHLGSSFSLDFSVWLFFSRGIWELPFPRLPSWYRVHFFLSSSLSFLGVYGMYRAYCFSLGIGAFLSSWCMDLFLFPFLSFSLPHIFLCGGDGLP